DSEGDVAVSSPKKETRTFQVKDRTPEGETVLAEHEFVLEHAISADFALVRAWKGDRHGNLVFRTTARNFNPLCAISGQVTIAEVEELGEAGELDQDSSHLPGIYVQRGVPLTPEQAAEKRIEKRTVRTESKEA